LPLLLPFVLPLPVAVSGCRFAWPFSVCQTVWECVFGQRAKTLSRGDAETQRKNSSLD
jgi:hypothetical protein